MPKKSLRNTETMVRRDGPISYGQSWSAVIRPRCCEGAFYGCANLLPEDRCERCEMQERAMTEPDDNPWRETVRDLYDKLHFGPHNIFTGNPLAQGIVAFIEERHPGYFVSPRDLDPTSDNRRCER